MGTQSSSWVREYLSQCIASMADSGKPISIRLFDGELDGHLFTATLWQWPPPERIYAGDFKYGAIGSYLLDGGDDTTLHYRCRIDDDYMRLKAGKLRIAVDKARERLTRHTNSKPRT